MICTDAHSCILVSYHPETQSGSSFLIKRDDLLMNIIKDICDSMLTNDILWNWYHNEIQELKLIGKKLVGNKIDFGLLKPLRTYIKKCTKRVVLVQFIDKIDFQL